MPDRETGAITKFRALDLVLLTWAAGMLDALCYLRAHVFAANMTGNIVIFGIDLAGNQSHRGIWNLAALLAFAAGAALAALVLLKWLAPRGGAAEVKSGLTLEAPFLLAFGVFSLVSPAKHLTWITAGLVFTGSCAMGVQSVAVRQLRISGVVTTFITGTMTTAITDWLSGKQQVGPPVNQPLWLAGMLAAYIGAAAVAARFLSNGIVPFLPFLCAVAVRLRWPADA